MRILESAPSRYDAGIRMLTLGRLDKAYDNLTSCIEEGQKVLDVGCGTGSLTLRAAQRGARVKGIDINPQMLEIAQNRAGDADLTARTEFLERGVAELGEEQSESYDVVMSGLCFSELSEEELVFALNEVRRVLKPGGLLLIADEVTARSVGKRVLNSILRFPLVVITYLLTQTTSHAVKDLQEKVIDSGLELKSAAFTRLGSFVELVAQKHKT